MQQVVYRGFLLHRHGFKQFSHHATPKTFNLFIGGLSYDTNEASVKNAFERHGEVIEANVICDRVSGKSKGFGFVKFAEEDGAMRALREMDGQRLDGRRIRVEPAKKGVDSLQLTAGHFGRVSCPSSSKTGAGGSDAAAWSPRSPSFVSFDLLRLLIAFLCLCIRYIRSSRFRLFSSLIVYSVANFSKGTGMLWLARFGVMTPRRIIFLLIYEFLVFAASSPR